MKPLALLAAACATAFLCAAQALPPIQSSDESYIPSVFEARIGETPKLGWFDPQRGFLALTDAPEVFLVAPGGLPETGRRIRTISGPEIRDVHRSGIACELDTEDRLTAFEVGAVAEASRALYVTKALSGSRRAGFATVELNPEWMANVNRALGWPSDGALRRDQAFAARVPSYFYSTHKLYSSETRLLQQEAIVLHQSGGAIVAVDLHRDLDTEVFCADCANPSYEDGGFGLFRPLNVFEVEGFPYPLVLLDTGTFEGRALSLLTFTPERRVATFRVYEYVFECGR
jgi:hypothetical protein